MAITQEELQSVVSAVLSSIRTNSRTIDQLTPVTSLEASNYFEINGGKRVSFSVLKELIGSLSSADRESLKILIDNNLEKLEELETELSETDYKLAKLAADIAGSLRTVDFSGVESPAIAPAVKAQTAAQPFSIVFLTTADKFVAKKGSEYYGGWGDAGMSDFYDDSGHIRKDCIFRDSSGALWYSPGAGKLVKFSTSEDLAKVKNIAEGAASKATQTATAVTTLSGRVDKAESDLDLLSDQVSENRSDISKVEKGHEKLSEKVAEDWEYISDMLSDIEDLQTGQGATANDVAGVKGRLDNLEAKPAFVPFWGFLETAEIRNEEAPEPGLMTYVRDKKKFVTGINVDGEWKYYSRFEGDQAYYDSNGKIRRDCIFYCKFALNIPKFYFAKTSDHLVYIPDERAHKDLLERIKSLQEEDSEIKDRVDAVEAKPAFVPFWGFLETAEISNEEAPEPGLMTYVRDKKKFVTGINVDGEWKYYSRFEGDQAYYDSVTGNLRKDCIFYCKGAAPLAIPQLYIAKGTNKLLYIPDEKDHKDLLERIKSLQEEDSEIKGRVDALEGAQRPMLPIYDIVDSAEIIQGYPDEEANYSGVVYVREAHKFVLKIGGSYYSNWKGQEQYMRKMGLPRCNCLFYMNSYKGFDRQWYFYYDDLYYIADSSLIEALEARLSNLEKVEKRVATLEAKKPTILPFKSILETAEIEEGGPDVKPWGGYVRYVSDQRKFVVQASSGGPYVGNWKGREDYHYSDGGVREDCIFLLDNYAKPKFYRFYSLKGLLIPLSDQLDIDTINKKIEKLENSEAAEVDLSPVETRLDSLEAEADGTVRIPCFDKMANDIEDYLEAGVKYYLRDNKAFLTPRGTGNADTEWRLQNLVVPEKSGWYIDRETGNLVFMKRMFNNGTPGIYHDHIWLESYHYDFEENIGAAFQYLVDEVVSPLEARVSALEAQEAEMQGEINELSMGVQELYCQLTGNYPTPLETPEAPMVMSLGEEAGEQTAVQTPDAATRREEALRRIREILKSRIRVGETEAEPPSQEQMASRANESSSEAEPPSQEQTASRANESSSEAEPPSQEQTGESTLGG